MSPLSQHCRSICSEEEHGPVHRSGDNMEAVIGASPFNPSGRLVFEKTTHKYFLAPGRELISVTQAIGIAFEGTLHEEFWTEESRARGSAIHEAILFHAQHDLDTSSLNPLIRPYWEGAEQFFRDERPEILHAEEPIYDEIAGYAGSFDLLCRLRGLRKAASSNTLDLLDAKTATVPWTITMQLAAYKRAIQRAYPDCVIRRWAWQLRPNGTYDLEEVSRWADHRSHEGDFLAALRVARMKLEQQKQEK